MFRIWKSFRKEKVDEKSVVLSAVSCLIPPNTHTLVRGPWWGDQRNVYSPGGLGLWWGLSLGEQTFVVKFPECPSGQCSHPPPARATRGLSLWKGVPERTPQNTWAVPKTVALPPRLGHTQSLTACLKDHLSVPLVCGSSSFCPKCTDFSSDSRSVSFSRFYGGGLHYTSIYWWVLDTPLMSLFSFFFL